MDPTNVRRALRHAVDSNMIPPFVYCYPPRSAYVPEAIPRSVYDVWRDDRQRSGDDLSIYFHVPFCRYRCGFCNLYTVTGASGADILSYSHAVRQQLRDSAEIIQSRRLRTVYVGGGTPTLMPIAELAGLFSDLSALYPSWRSIVEEVAIEASPDTLAGVAGKEYARQLRDLGFTRVNLGVQSLESAELKEAGRGKAGASVVADAVENIRHACIPNLSTDLIIGFHGQTDHSWSNSVSALIALQPETISTYFLTVRPDASFGRLGRYSEERDGQLYGRYESARDRLKEAGYVQETNVRYKKPGRGGYVQKVLQFRGVPVLGIGAGARTYTNTTDYLIGGAAVPHRKQLSDYQSAVANRTLNVSSAFVFDDEERIRKRLALDLFDLRLSELTPFGFEKYAMKFLPILDAAEQEGFLTLQGPSHYHMTEKGFQYRDILSWMFFSDRVIARDRTFYASLRAGSAAVS